MNLCPKCNTPRRFYARRSTARKGQGHWYCPTCGKEREQAREAKFAVNRRASGQDSRAQQQQGKLREGCICATGGEDICPVHAPGEVERRILAADDFWRAFQC